MGRGTEMHIRRSQLPSSGVRAYGAAGGAGDRMRASSEPVCCPDLSFWGRCREGATPRGLCWDFAAGSSFLLRGLF